MSWKAAEHSNPTHGVGAESHQNRSVFSRRMSALMGASRRFHTKASALRSHHQRAKHSGPGTSHLRPAFNPVSQPNSHWGVSTVPPLQADHCSSAGAPLLRPDVTPGTGARGQALPPGLPSATLASPPTTSCRRSVRLCGVHTRRLIPSIPEPETMPCSFLRDHPPVR